MLLERRVGFRKRFFAETDMSDCCRPSINVARGERGQPVLPEPMAGAGAAAAAIRVEGGETFVGTDAPVIAVDGEGPRRRVRLHSFLLEPETVTVERFMRFVEATGYRTEAEIFGWSVVFTGMTEGEPAGTATLSQTPWWRRIEGANWKQPEGPGSSIADRLDHPVIQVSWNDAVAFARWAGGRLPTEAEWEHAARGGNRQRRFPWGDDEPSDDAIFCNIWQGRFPVHNTARDGYPGTAPARSFAPNELGFYNLSGNVWEWTADPFRVRSLARAAKARNETARRHDEKVLKGGSFLCHISYCYRYRIAARMGLSPDSGSSNTGFRVAYDI